MTGLWIMFRGPAVSLSVHLSFLMGFHRNCLIRCFLFYHEVKSLLVAKSGRALFGWPKWCNLTPNSSFQRSDPSNVIETSYGHSVCAVSPLLNSFNWWLFKVVSLAFPVSEIRNKDGYWCIPRNIDKMQALVTSLCQAWLEWKVLMSTLVWIFPS